jgi:hypothetical protein
MTDSPEGDLGALFRAHHACGSDSSAIGWLAGGAFHPLASYADLTSQAAW